MDIALCTALHHLNTIALFQFVCIYVYSLNWLLKSVYWGLEVRRNILFKVNSSLNIADQPNKNLQDQSLDVLSSTNPVSDYLSSKIWLKSYLNRWRWRWFISDCVKFFLTCWYHKEPDTLCPDNLAGCSFRSHNGLLWPWHEFPFPFLIAVCL